MAGNLAWQPFHDDPLFIVAMDHRDSFGKTLFDVRNDDPGDTQRAAMKSAKQLIFEGLQQAVPMLTSGRAGVLVDEQHGQGVIDKAIAGGTPVVLAVPIEASGHDWFTLRWGDHWFEHVERIRPDYAKVLVRDNPDFNAAQRERQFGELALVSTELAKRGVPLLCELLVPATDGQLDQAGGYSGAYDRDIRSDLVVVKVIADKPSVRYRAGAVEGRGPGYRRVGAAGGRPGKGRRPPC